MFFLRKRFLFTLFITFVLIFSLGLYVYIDFRNEKAKFAKFWNNVLNKTYVLSKDRKNIFKVIKSLEYVCNCKSIIFLKKKFMNIPPNKADFIYGEYYVFGKVNPNILDELYKVNTYELDKFKVFISLPLYYEDKNLGKAIFILEYVPNVSEYIFLFLLVSFPFLLITFSFIKNEKNYLREFNFLRYIFERIGEGNFNYIDLLRKSLREKKDIPEIKKLKISIIKSLEEMERKFLQMSKEKDFYEKMAFYDALTGLYTRAIFSELAERKFREAERYGEAFSILLLDIDDFKKINDTYGHEVGDKVLKKLAEVILSNIRRADIPARWGGEEFLIFLPKTNLSSAVKVAEKIRKAVENAFVELAGGKKLKFTVSIGVSSYRGQKSLAEIIKEADVALYEAKRKGKNRVEVYKKGLSF